VLRHVYQSSKGGSTYIPLEVGSCLINGNTTPRFGKMVSWKYSEMSSGRLIEDMKENHGREISSKFVQQTMHRIGRMIREPKQEWAYSLPPNLPAIEAISISRDGTTSPIKGQGYRETMNGSISLFDKLGERVHTIYVANAPEYGKKSFNKSLTDEILKIKDLYPDVKSIGLADGSADNWTFLEPHTDIQVLDFWHATEYLSKVSKVVFSDVKTSKLWLDDACHRLKHDKGAVKDLIKELNQAKIIAKKSALATVQSAITYFTNQKKRMKYHKYVDAKFPIGSGIIEAACKTITKQRLSNSGMRWNIGSVDDVLACRTLTHTPGRWKQTWDAFMNAA
jgi:hypothetical protein